MPRLLAHGATLLAAVTPPGGDTATSTPAATSTYALRVHNAPRTALPPQGEALATMTPDEHRASPLDGAATLTSPGAQVVRPT